MKKLLCIFPALLLFASIGAPNARADSYTPAFTCTSFYGCAPISAPDVSFNTPTTDITVTVTAGAVAEFTISLPAADAPTDVYEWTYGATPPQGLASPLHDYVGELSITDETTDLTDMEFITAQLLPYSDDIWQGFLTFSPVSASAPEPAPIILMLLASA